MERSVQGLMLLMCSALVAAHPHLRATHSTNGVASVEHTCDGEHETERSRLIGESSCGVPREEFIELRSEGTHSSMFPSAVWVKRCKGVCFDVNKACVATKKREREIPVREVDLSQETCAVVKVEEHLQCGCQCRIKAADCTHGERFNHQT